MYFKDFNDFYVYSRSYAIKHGISFDNITHEDYYGNDRTIDTHIKMLRKNLAEYRDLITTVRGMGYKFEIKK